MTAAIRSATARLRQARKEHALARPGRNSPYTAIIAALSPIDRAAERCAKQSVNSEPKKAKSK